MNCKQGEKATAIYVKHSDNTPISPSPDTIIQLNQKILLKPFAEKIFCECNTKDFVDQLGIASGIFPPADDPKCTQNWLESFKQKAIPYGEELFFTLTTRILFELNILTRDIIHAQDFRQSAIDGIVNDWFINYYFFRAAQLLGDKTIMREYAKRYVGEKLPTLLIDKKKISRLRNNSMALDYYTATGVGINALILHQKPSKVNTNISVNDGQKPLVQWAPTSQYNRYLTGTIVLISFLPFISSLIIKTREIELQNLITSMMKILERGYEGVVSVNQINIANRAVGLAKNLLNIDSFAENQGLIDQAMQDYANTTHMHGVSTTMIFSVYSFCQDYKRTKNPHSKECAIRDLKYAAKIVKVTNDRTLFLRLFLAKLYSTYVLRKHIPFRIFRSEVIFDDELNDS